MERDSNALMTVLRTNQFLPTVESWIERDKKEVDMSNGSNNSEKRSKSDIRKGIVVARHGALWNVVVLTAWEMGR